MGVQGKPAGQEEWQGTGREIVIGRMITGLGLKKDEWVHKARAPANSESEAIFKVPGLL